MRRLFAILAVALVVGGAPDAQAGRAAGRPGRAERSRPRLVIDVGGEGRLPHAVNLNPGRVTSTTGTPGRPIPHHVQGVGEKMPFASHVADELRVENAPLRPGAAAELSRVIKPGGRIVLRHPADYAADHHGQVLRRIGGSHQQRRVGGMTITIIRAPPGTAQAARRVRPASRARQSPAGRRRGRKAASRM